MARNSKKKPKQVVHLRRTPTPKSQRKDPPEKIRAASSTGVKPTDDGDSTSTFVPSVVNHVLYSNVAPRGVANDLSPITERQAVDNASVGNSAISTVTMIENAEDLELLAKADDSSVGDDGSSDAVGGGEFERTLLKEGAQQASIEQRDHDNANIEENVLMGFHPKSSILTHMRDFLRSSYVRLTYFLI